MRPIAMLSLGAPNGVWTETCSIGALHQAVEARAAEDADVGAVAGRRSSGRAIMRDAQPAQRRADRPRPATAAYGGRSDAALGDDRGDQRARA